MTEGKNRGDGPNFIFENDNGEEARASDNAIELMPTVRQNNDHPFGFEEENDASAEPNGAQSDVQVEETKQGAGNLLDGMVTKVPEVDAHQVDEDGNVQEVDLHRQHFEHTL